MSYQENKLMNLKDGRLLLETLDVAGRIAGSIAVSDSTEEAVKTLTDGADNLPMAVQVGIDPVQDLHGYEYPWSGGAGKNLCPYMTKENQGAGITTTLNDDGTVVFDGTTGNGAKFYALSSAFEVTAGVSYILSGCPANGSLTSYRLDIRSGSTIDLDQELGTLYDYGSGVTFTPTTTHNIRISVRLGANYTANNLKFYPMVRVSSTSADYEPYSNVCPITGWTGCNLYRAGFNLWDGEWESGDINSNTGENTTNSGIWRSKNYIPVLPNTAYYAFSPTAEHKTIRARFYDKNKNYIGYAPKTGTTYTDSEFVTPDNAYYMRIAPNNTGIPNHDVCINFSDSAKNGTYQAFKGISTIPVTWEDEAGTVYGGSLTVNEDGSGKLVVDSGYKDLGTLSWTKASGNYFYAEVSGIKTVAISSIPNLICSQYKADIGSNVISGNYNNTIGVSSSQPRVLVCDSRYSDAQTFTTAMDGVQIVYELATPVTFNLTAQQVRSLLGVNNLFADCGNILAVSYHADTKMYIDGKVAELQALILENT